MPLEQFIKPEEKDFTSQTDVLPREDVVEVKPNEKPVGGLTATAVSPKMSASQEAYNKYQRAIADLNTALEKRLNPENQSAKWFALAEAFLSPTATGSFGESVGKGARALREAQAGDEAKTMQLAQMRAELAKGEYEMAGQKDAMDYIQRKYLGQTTTPITITKADLPAVAKVLGRAEDDPTLQTLIGAPRNLFITSSGQNMIGGGSGFKVAPDVIEQLMATYGSQPQKVLEKLFELEKEFIKPTDIQKDMSAFLDPNVPAIMKQAIAIKYLADGVKQVPVQTERGKVFMSINDLLAKQGITLPSGGAQTTTTSGATTSVGGVSSGKTTTTSEKPTKGTNVYGLAPESEEAVALKKKAGEEDIEVFKTSIEKPLLEKVEKERDISNRIDRTLRVLDNTKTGAGTSFGMLWNQAKSLFTDLSPEENEQLINAKTLDQTSKQLVVDGLKAAFGGQLSEGERDFFIQTLFTINDPKEFIRATLELKKASVMISQDLARTLSKNRLNKREAYDDYLENNRGLAILEKYAPTAYGLANSKKGSAPAPRKSTDSSTPKTVVRTGKVTEGPNKGKTAVEYSDGTIGYQ